MRTTPALPRASGIGDSSLSAPVCALFVKAVVKAKWWNELEYFDIKD